MVLNETTEEGIIFQTGIVLGEKGIFQGITIGKCIVMHAMPEYALGWVPV